VSKRRAILDVEKGSRLDQATEQDARIVLGIRCAAPGCGRALAAVLNPAEGLLFVTYIEISGEFKSQATFVDELQGEIVLRCRRHGRRPQEPVSGLDAASLRAALERREPGTISL
jgi:hypothetical protein